MSTGSNDSIDIRSIFDMEGKVALVTGASSGLGQRFTRVLHAAGAHVVLAARRRERLVEASTGLERATYQVCDVGSDAQVASLLEFVADRYGRLDVLVNNAGVGASAPAETEPMADFERVVALNLTAQYRLARAASELLFRHEGTIVNVASIFGLVAAGSPPLGAYAASKGGLISLTRELAAQWGPRGVRVNALAPGWFRSEMTENRISTPKWNDWIRTMAVLARPGDEHELDGALLFLATDASSYVTGQVVAVDGGWSVR